MGKVVINVNSVLNEYLLLSGLRGVFKLFVYHFVSLLLSLMDLGDLEEFNAHHLGTKSSHRSLQDKQHLKLDIKYQRERNRLWFCFYLTI